MRWRIWVREKRKNFEFLSLRQTSPVSTGNVIGLFTGLFSYPHSAPHLVDVWAKRQCPLYGQKRTFPGLCYPAAFGENQPPDAGAVENRLLIVSAFASVLLFSGCGRVNPLRDDSYRVTESSRPILLMTATTKSETSHSYSQPRLMNVRVAKPDVEKSSEMISFYGAHATKITPSANTGNSFLIGMDLDPGRYEIESLSLDMSKYSYGSLIPIRIYAPLFLPIEVKESGVFYLGHVDVTERRRRGNEFAIGSWFVYRNSTFDIEIADDFATDETLFRSTYPALEGVTIKKMILPSFDRAKVQRLWETGAYPP